MCFRIDVYIVAYVIFWVCDVQSYLYIMRFPVVVPFCRGTGVVSVSLLILDGNRVFSVLLGVYFFFFFVLFFFFFGNIFFFVFMVSILKNPRSLGSSRQIFTVRVLWWFGFGVVICVFRFMLFGVWRCPGVYCTLVWEAGIRVSLRFVFRIFFFVFVCENHARVAVNGHGVVRVGTAY